MINDYIKNNTKKNVLNEYSIFKHVLFLVQKPFKKKINLDLVVSKIESILPEHFSSFVDEIIIGNFPEFKKKEVNSLYKDGAIYISYKLPSEDDVIKCIVHEWSHAVEEHLQDVVYSDGNIEKEFLLKRKWLYLYLKAHGFVDENHFAYFANPEYSAKFDAFIYKSVGYDKLTVITAPVFLSPYAITSLREYFADGFEDYFLTKDYKRIKDISPALFDKLELLGEHDERWLSDGSEAMKSFQRGLADARDGHVGFKGSFAKYADEAEISKDSSSFEKYKWEVEDE